MHRLAHRDPKGGFSAFTSCTEDATRDVLTSSVAILLRSHLVKRSSYCSVDGCASARKRERKGVRRSWKARNRCPIMIHVTCHRRRARPRVAAGRAPATATRRVGIASTLHVLTAPRASNELLTDCKHGSVSLSKVSNSAITVPVAVEPVVTSGSCQSPPRGDIRGNAFHPFEKALSRLAQRRRTPARHRPQQINTCSPR